MAECVSTPGVEEVVFEAALARLAAGEIADAATLAGLRLERSPWAQVSTGVGTWETRWRALQAAAVLRAAVRDHQVPNAGAAGLLDWYVADGWRVDGAHRRVELARSELTTFGGLEPEFNKARAEYEKWLDLLLSRFTSALEDADVAGDGLLRQGDIHTKFVAPSDPPVAYVWVDALRYELGAELKEALEQVAQSVQLHAAMAAAPTTTLVGMANLAPRAAEKLTIALGDDDKLAVSVGGTVIKGVADRLNLLRLAHGHVIDLDLNSVSQLGEKALRDQIQGASAVLVRSQEVDAAGESGMLSIAWSGFDALKGLLVSLVARLGQAGVHRVVITADHGFVALSRGLGSDRILDPPEGGRGELHRRGWAGRGSSVPEAAVRIPVAALGIPGDVELVVPRGLAVFRAAGGNRQFFHGGLSPQELVVPVIVVDAEPAAEPQKLRVDVSVAGGRITTGTFAASLQFHGDLFKREVTVRVVARTQLANVVARAVSGDAFDPGAGTITVSVGQPTVLAFQVTENLEKGSEVEVQVLDARTARILATASATVAAPVYVEDELA